MALIQLEAHLKAESEMKAAMGRHVNVTAHIVVPFSAGFGGAPPPPRPLPKNALKIASMDVGTKKEG